MVLRNYRDNNQVTQDELIVILQKTRATLGTRKKITITERKLNKYFPAYYSQTEIEKIIIDLLVQWNQEQEEN